MNELDRLVKKRSVVRRAFTKIRNELEERIRSKETEQVLIKASFQVLENKSEELLELDAKIFELKLDCDEQELDQEVSEGDEYQQQYFKTKVSINEIFTFDNFKDSSKESINTDLNSKSNKYKYKLPKLEFIKYSGDVKEWQQFWSQFESIHKDDDLEDEIKFQYLIQATVKGSKAREVVESFPPIADNYGKAVERLKFRFGRDELLVDVCVRELLKMMKENSNSKPISLSSLYDNIKLQVRALEALGIMSDNCAALLYVLAESCLPGEFLKAWLRSQDFKQSFGKNKLENFIKFLKSEIESAERIKLAMNGFGLKNESKEHRNKNEEEATATSLQVNTTNMVRCIFCGKHHEPCNCIKAQAMTLAEKLKTVKEKRACYKCLRRGHSVKICKFKVKCVLCGRAHYALMCPRLPHNKEGPIEEKVDNDKKTESVSL